MIDRFEIIGFNERPDADRIIFCDGSGGPLFNPDTDLELSHWRPSRTPPGYLCGTSTEICFRFLDHPQPGPWTVAVNNHLDVDGILSVYVLIHSEDALRHRAAIVQAAEMGDFWSWGDPPAQRLFQGLTWLMKRREAEEVAPREIYAEAFDRVVPMLSGSDPETGDIEDSLAPLHRGAQQVEEGLIPRRLVDDRLAMYVVPGSLSPDSESELDAVPEFNAAITEQLVFWPQVRARWDRERVCLVSIETEEGWRHSLWYPGYLWAETVGWWQVPGLTYHDGMNGYDLSQPPLIRALEELSARERRERWASGAKRDVLSEQIQSQFPLAARVVNDEGEGVPNDIPPEEVAERLKNCFGNIAAE